MQLKLHLTACLGVFLVIGLVAEIQAKSLEKESLPTLVLNEGDEDTYIGADRTEVKEEQTNSVVGRKDEPKRIDDLPSQGSDEEKKQPTGQDQTIKYETAASKPADPTEQPSSSSSSKPTEVIETTTKPADRQENTSQADKIGDEKKAASESDLKSLLENKNDAENDLSIAPTSSNSPATLDQTPAVVIKTASPTQFEGPTDTDKPVDDRFHYSLGSDKPIEAKKEQPADKPLEPATANASTTEEDNEAEKDKAPKSDAASESSGSESDEEEKEEKETPVKPSVEEQTKTESAVSSTPVVSSSKDQAPNGVVVKSDEGIKPVTSSNESLPPVKQDSSTSEVTSTSTTTESAEKPLEDKKEQPSLDEVKPQVDVKPTVPVSSDEKEEGNKKKPVESSSETSPTVTTNASATSVRPSSEAKDEPVKSNEASITTTISTTTSSTGVSTTSAPLAPKSEPKDKAVQSSSSESVAAAAAAAASAAASIGAAAVNPVSAGKEKAAASTTSKPPSGSSSTRAPSSTRKSSTDRWNRWQPTTPAGVSSTSSTPLPSTRRRPILPSIRRRFRPYNRFSPFPWPGPESYAPFGGPDMGPPSHADVEPDFGRPPFGGNYSPSSKSSTLKPRRRHGSSTSEPQQPTRTSVSSKSGSEVGVDDDNNSSDNVTPNVSTRRRYGNGSKRPTGGSSNKHNFDDDALDQGDQFAPSDPFGGHRGSSRPHHGHRHHHRDQHNHRDHHNRHEQHHRNQRPYYGANDASGVFSPTRPLTPGFGLFNSVGSSGSTGSGFDLLNPFSWVDEITKPRPSLFGQNRPHSGADAFDRPARPLGGNTGLAGGAGEPGSHFGHAARPSGPPIAVEGEFGRPGGERPTHPEPSALGPQHHGHDHDHGHDHHHRPHRPLTGSHGRDDYYDDHHHDCHHEHEHEHDYEHGHDHHRPHQPSRPIRPIPTDEYESGYGRRPIGGRPDRPYYNRRDQSSTRSPQSSEPNPSDSTIVRETETLNSESSSGRPTLSSSAAAPPSGVGSGPTMRRTPLFSPFDSLFGTLDDDLFGGLRSSFVDAPLRAASSGANAAFDAIVSSPKITLPLSAEQPKSVPASIEALDKPQASPVAGESSKPLSSIQERNTDVEGDKAAAKLESAEPSQQKSEFSRGGIRHFLLMI